MGQLTPLQPTATLFVLLQHNKKKGPQRDTDATVSGAAAPRRCGAAPELCSEAGAEAPVLSSVLRLSPLERRIHACSCSSGRVCVCGSSLRCGFASTPWKLTTSAAAHQNKPPTPPTITPAWSSSLERHQADEAFRRRCSSRNFPHQRVSARPVNPSSVSDPEAQQLLTGRNRTSNLPALFCIPSLCALLPPPVPPAGPGPPAEQTADSWVTRLEDERLLTERGGAARRS